jgi:5-methylcytosine-specific restriction endonuclease McrA
MKTYNCLNCGTEHNWKGISYANKYCNNKCQRDFEYKQYIAEWKNGTIDGRKGALQTSSHIKRYILEKQDGKCAGCGLDSWLGSPITLELEHIDGNGHNNVENNLKCLCPNCHSQTPTYKSKNKGNGRRNRKS